jgi:tetratricopeptide (TPR) repeat protein
MLFPSDSVTATRRRLLEQVQEGRITMEQMLERVLALDEKDSLALEYLAQYHAHTGELDTAEQYCWRAVEADPVLSLPWLTLYSMADERNFEPALRNGMLELGARKTLRDPHALERFVSVAKDNPLPGDMQPQEYLDAAATVFEPGRDDPPEIAARLQPYRLIDELVETAFEGLDEGLIEAILAEGSRCLPLLVGVLRAYAYHRLEDNTEAVASAALLGEIGDPAAVPALVEFCGLPDEEISDAAHWGLRRLAQQRPEETVRAVREMLPSNDFEVRIAVTLALHDLPPQPDQTEMLVGLLDGLEAFEKSRRHELFVAVGTTLLVHDPSSAPRVWSLLDRYDALLPKRTRKEMKDASQAISALQSLKDEEPSRPPELTVYDFCSGAPEQEEEEEEEPQAAAPAPRHATPGRNDPCWCGSGKKYKKCHREADEQARLQPGAGEDRPPESAAHAAEEALRGRVLEFALDILRKSEVKRAVARFVGTEAPETNESDTAAFADWLLHDYVAPRIGRTMIEEFLRRPAGGITQAQRRLLEDWSHSRYSLLEAQEVSPGTSVTVKDLLTGEQFVAADVSTSKRVSRWDCWLARYERSGEGYQLCGIGTVVARSEAAPLRDWALEAQRRSGLDWDAFLRANSHKLRLKAAELRQADWSALRIVSHEGDPLLLSRAVYKVTDPSELQRALEACDAWVREDDDPPGEYHWLEPEESDGGRRVLGRVQLQSGRLTLECMTRQRLERGKELLQSLAGGALRHLGDELKDVKSELKSMPAEDAEPSSLPPEIEAQVVQKFLAEHYRKWPDMSLPALDGKTPREAAALPEYRGKLIELLKRLENGEEHNRREGRPWHDVSSLRAELGVE